jgi:O-acetyl-ADP-ribose deacetylase
LNRSAVRIVCESGQTIEIHGPADITAQDTEAIVNAANSSLMGGGGVDGAIHRAGGGRILEECKQHVSTHGRLPVGQAMVTCGGRLQAKYVVHAVGPVYRDGKSGEPELLASCHRETIRIADERKIRSIAFPAISTGAYGYPLHEAAAIALSAALEALEQAEQVQCVRFVLFDHAAVKAYTKAAQYLLKHHPKLRIDHMLTPKA